MTVTQAKQKMKEKSNTTISTNAAVPNARSWSKIRWMKMPPFVKCGHSGFVVIFFGILHDRSIASRQRKSR
jgi:hypothetical protein